MEEECEDPINITVKTINNDAFDLKISRNISIRTLKTKIKDSTEIEEDRQRLIYRGQVLADQSLLNDYSIEDGHTIHLVSRPHNFREMQQSVENTATNDANNAASQSRNMLRSLQEQVFASANPLLALQSLGDSAFQSNRESNQGTTQQQRAIAENSLEHIRQGFLTINTLISTMTAVGAPERNSEEEDLYEDLGAPFTIKSPHHSLRMNLRNASTDIKATDDSTEGSGGCRKRRREPVVGVLPSTGSGRGSRGDEKAGSSTDLNQSSQLAECKSSSSVDYSEEEDQNDDDDEDDERNDFPYQVDHENISTDANMDTTAQIETNNNNQFGASMYTSTPNRASITPPNQSTQYFVGQWLDVRDTVNQWLEATVLQVEINDLGTQRVFVHYNGWPSRWDEWLPSDSQRIAPFRTRTVHSTTLPHSSPSPAIPAPLAQNIGHDDVRELLPELCDMLRRITPAIEEVASLSTQSLSDRPVAAVPVTVDLPNTSAGSSNASEVPDDTQTIPTPGNTSTTTSRRRRYAESPRMRLLASELCPILDRLGRILTDLSPHLKSLADDTDEEDGEVAPQSGRGALAFSTSSSSSSSSSRRRRSNRAEQHAEDDSSLGLTSSRTVAGSNRSSRRLNRLRESALRSREESSSHRSRVAASTSDGALLSILSPRSTNQFSDRVYRQPILSSSVRPGSSPFGGGGVGGMLGSNNNHLDIHIHAILTPFRPVGRFGASDTPILAPIPATTSASTTTAAATSTTTLATMAETIVNDFIAMETTDITDTAQPSPAPSDSSAPPTTTSADSTALPASPDLPLSSPLIVPSTSVSELSVAASTWTSTSSIESDSAFIVLSSPPITNLPSLPPPLLDSHHSIGIEITEANHPLNESHFDSGNILQPLVIRNPNDNGDLALIAPTPTPTAGITVGEDVQTPLSSQVSSNDVAIEVTSSSGVTNVEQRCITPVVYSQASTGAGAGVVALVPTSTSPKNSCEDSSSSASTTTTVTYTHNVNNQSNDRPISGRNATVPTTATATATASSSLIQRFRRRGRGGRTTSGSSDEREEGDDREGDDTLHETET